MTIDHSVPYLLVSRQFAGSEPPEYNDQCDCACADNGFSLTQRADHADVPLRRAQVHLQPLPGDHMLAFNTLHDTGVVVMNRSAADIWRTFDIPAAVDAIPDAQTRAIVEQMHQVGLLEPQDSTVKPRQRMPETLSAWLHITNECNLRCDYCYIHKSNDDMSEETGRAAVDAVFRSALNHGFKRVKLKFAGGEATLNLRLVFMLHDYAAEIAARHEVGLDSVILSNGVTLGVNAIRQIKACGIRVMISLDGIGADHDSQRHFINGKGSFAWVDRTIKRLGEHGLKPFISITVSDRNVMALPLVIDYVLENDLPFNINFYRDNECASGFDDLRLQDDRLIESILAAFALIERRLPTRSVLGSLIDRAQLDRPHNHTCGVGDSYMVIDHHGQVAKCQMEIEKPVTDVYAHDPLALIRADQIGVQNIPVEEKEGCRTCDWRYWCAGGCPVVTFRATGRFDVKSPYCRVYKALYPAALRLEGLRLLKLGGLPV